MPLALGEARRLEMANGTIAYYESGSGAHTIVWLHGLPLDSRSWAAQQEYFDSRARNVFLDLRGYGASDKLPPRAGSVTALYVDDLAALIDHLRLDRPAVVGFASAGHVALRHAALHPGQIGKLAVINASPKFRRGPDWPYGFDEKAISRFVTAAAERGIDGLTDEVLKPQVVFGDVSPQRAAELDAWFRPMSLNAGAGTLLGFFESIAADDDRTLLPEIDAPTLLIASTIGQEVPAEVSLYLRTAIPGARLAELPGTDHFAFATRPDLVNNLLDAFITS
jgi:non-heme chloroperoxidase